MDKESPAMKIPFPFTPEWRRLSDPAALVANLHAEEAHAVTDLTLYTVNTGALYRDKVLPVLTFQGARLAKGQSVTPAPWRSLTQAGLESYRQELKACPLDAVRNFRRALVMEAACAAIIEHYAEELAEHIARARNA